MKSTAAKGSVRIAIAGLLAFVGSVLPLPAQTPSAPAPGPAPRAAAGGERQRWVDVLVEQSRSADPDVARSARIALEALRAGDRERSDAPRPPRGGPAGGPLPGRPFRGGDDLGPRRDRPFPPDGERRPPEGPRGPRDGDQGPRTGPDGSRPFDGPPEPPPRCGPGCCLHGFRARRDGGRPPLGPPPGEFPRPGQRGEPRRRLDGGPDHDPDGPPPFRPFPPRDGPRRPPVPAPKET